MLNFFKDERGSILPIMAAVIVVLIGISAVAVDFARYAVASEKLKTATDAASLAGATGANRYVKLLIDPGSSRDCCGDDPCSPCCVDCGDPIEVTGKEKDLLDNNGWKRYCCSCGCDGLPKILDRWVEYEGNNAQSAAIMLFNANKPEEMSSGQGGDSWLSRISVHKERSDPHYPSVTVEASGKIKTLFLNFLSKIVPADFSYLKTRKCSQAETRYYELNGKFVKTAEGDCD